MYSVGWRMTGDAEFVSIRISKIRAIVMFVIFGPQAGRAFRYGTVSDCNGETFVYDCAALGEKRNHVPVPWLRR